MDGMGEITQLREIDASVAEDIGILVGQLSPNFQPPSQEILKRIVGNPDYELWVVRDGKRIVGMGTLITLVMTIGITAFFEDIIVHDEYRGSGFGKAIMAKLIERAKACGASHIDLTSNPKRTAANAFYKKFGFEMRETNVYRLKL